MCDTPVTADQCGSSPTDLAPWIVANHLLPLAARIYRVQKLLERFQRTLLRPGTLSRRLVKRLIKSFLRAKNLAGQSRSVAPVARLEREYKDATRVTRIAILRLDHIGDAVMSISAIRLLREQFQEAEVTLICGRWMEPLARHWGLYDQVIGCDIYSALSCEAARDDLVAARLPADIKSIQPFDIAIDLCFDTKTRHLLLDIPANFRAGFHAPGMGQHLDMMFPFCLPDDWNNPRSATPAQALNAGLVASVAAAFRSRHWVETTLRQKEVSYDEAPGRTATICIAPGCGTETRAWPIDMFAELIKRIVERTNAHIILAGSARECASASILESLIPEERVTNLSGKTAIENFVTAIRSVDVFVGNDTGTTHLAAGSGIATVCMFTGAGPLGRHAPAGRACTVLYPVLPCTACSWLKVDDCPHGFRCARSIRVDLVFTTILEKLNRQQLTNG